MSVMGLIYVLCALGGAYLLAKGAQWLLKPNVDVTKIGHDPSKLTLVLGGRYLFLGFILLAALFRGDHTMTSVVLAGLAGLGGLDALIYRKMQPWPHIFVACGAAFGSVFFLLNGKVAP